MLINVQPNKGFVMGHLPATVYESGQYDDSKLKESWRLLVRHHQSQEMEIFESMRNTAISHFPSWVISTDIACLLQINIRNDLNTLIKCPFFSFNLLKPTPGALP